MTPLKEQWREELHKTRFFQEGGFCFEACDYERMCGDMEFFVEMLVKHTRTQALQSVLEKIESKKEKDTKEQLLNQGWLPDEAAEKLAYEAVYNQALSDLSDAIKNEQET